MLTFLALSLSSFTCSLFLTKKLIRKLRNEGCHGVSVVTNKHHLLQLSESPTLLFQPWLLTVVGEACFAETHEQVLLYFIRLHELGADGAVEAWQKKNNNTKIRTWGPRCGNVCLITFYWYVHRRGRGTVCMGGIKRALHDHTHLHAPSICYNQSVTICSPNQTIVWYRYSLQSYCKPLHKLAWLHIYCTMFENSFIRLRSLIIPNLTHIYSRQPARPRTPLQLHRD